MKDVEAFGVRLHQAVFDPVVHHFYEVSRARWPAVKVTVFDRAVDLFASRSAYNLTRTGGQSFEDRIEMTNRFLRPADHHAIAAFEAPYAAACSHIDVVNFLLAQHASAAHIVFEVRVATIDNDVVSFQSIGEVSNCFLRSFTGWNHDPNDPRLI